MPRYSKQYAREEHEERKSRAAKRKKARQVKAHKRRVAGKVVHVKGYCRRPSKVARKVGSARQTGGDWGF